MVNRYFKRLPKIATGMLGQWLASKRASKLINAIDSFRNFKMFQMRKPYSQKKVRKTLGKVLVPILRWGLQTNCTNSPLGLGDVGS